MLGNLPPDVYTAGDIAAAAGVSDVRVLDLLARGEIRSVAARWPIGGRSELAGFGAQGEGVSIYVYDPEDNLVELKGATH